MANEKRVRGNFAAGALDVALTTTTTSLSSPGLADLPVVDATNHAALSLITRNSDGRVTAKEIVYVTAHTASATTATIARGKEGTSDPGTTWAVGTKWVHADTAGDRLLITTSKPTNGTTRASSTLGALATPWQAAVVVLAGQVVDIEVTTVSKCSSDTVSYMAVARGSTVIAKSGSIYSAADGTRTASWSANWTDESPGTGTVTYEVYCASFSGTITMTTGGSGTTISTTHDGSACMKITARFPT